MRCPRNPEKKAMADNDETRPTDDDPISEDDWAAAMQ